MFLAHMVLVIQEYILLISEQDLSDQIHARGYEELFG